jgi:hypothetical protein
MEKETAVPRYSLFARIEKEYIELIPVVNVYFKEQKHE